MLQMIELIGATCYLMLAKLFTSCVEFEIRVRAG